MTDDRSAAQHRRAVTPRPSRRSTSQVQFESLEVATAYVGQAADLRGMASQEAGELAQDRLGARHRRGPQGEGDLVQVAQQRGSEPRRYPGPLPGTTSGVSRAVALPSLVGGASNTPRWNRVASAPWMVLASASRSPLAGR